LRHEVFISHTTGDRLKADALCRRWRPTASAAGSLRATSWGQDYAEALVDAVASCRALVLVFSRHANDSAHVRRELELAVRRGVPIVPIRVEDAPMAKTAT